MLSFSLGWVLYVFLKFVLCGCLDKFEFGEVFRGSGKSSYVSLRISSELFIILDFKVIICK